MKLNLENMLISFKESRIPKVSIGMPVYNGDKFLREALNSLLGQTFTDFKLHISDNASTDDTEAICREYAARDPRIRYVRQSDNMGAAANFQFVLDEARGEYFMWAAHDDTWEPNYLIDSTILLNDKSIAFIFPTFSIQSIILKINKKFHADIFKFIESTNRKTRVLQFLALHHNSHKCNIIYSLFRTEFIKTALKIQGIENDGALGAVILGLGRGKSLSKALFNKRYPIIWPGMSSVCFAGLHKNRSKEFELAKESSLNILSALFPEYLDDINNIYDCYYPYAHEKCYRICSIDNEHGSEVKIMEPHRPVVSIGMPVYNAGKYIREAIDSLLAQTFISFELIISDNASTDNTEAICREYAGKDSRIRYVRQPDNRGPVANFRFVLNQARSDYFMWAAHDDVWDSQWIEVLLPVSASHQCVAYGIVQSIDAHGIRMIHPANNRIFNFKGNRFLRRFKYYIEPGFMGKANPIYGIFPTSKLLELDFSIFESAAYGADMLFLYDLLNQMEIRHGKRVYYYKRIHDDCIGGGRIKEGNKLNGLVRVVRFMKGTILGPMLNEYIRRSDVIESCCLIIAYPACVTWCFSKTMAWKIRRILNMR